MNYDYSNRTKSRELGFEDRMKSLKDLCRASIYQKLCLRTDYIATAGVENLPKNERSVAGYEIIGSKFDKKDNFKSAVFRKGNEIVVCFAGTDIRSPRDILTDIQMLVYPILSPKPSQLKSADTYISKIQKDFPNCKIVAAGHSEGGDESLFSGAAKVGIEAFAFNPYGARKFVNDDRKNRIDREKLYNYKTPNDIVSRRILTVHIGQVTVIPAVPKPEASSKFEPVYSHRLENIDFDRVIDEEISELRNQSGFYALSKELGIDKLYQTHHEMRLAEVDRKKRELAANRNSTSTQNETTNTAGEVYVNSYTRQDGTEVDSYFRSLPNR